MEREKVREVEGSLLRPSSEGPQSNIEKVGAPNGFLSKKRKERESNGFLHENDVGSTKLTIRLPPYPPPMENGRTSDHPPPLLSPPVKLSSSSSETTATNNIPANINTIKAEVPSIKKATHLNGTVADAKLSKKRKEELPHPDLKYLNVVYSVPKLEEKELMPPFDDQEWLYSTKPNFNRNPNSMMLEYGLSQRFGQVWDRAVLLGSADAFALPYVLPF